MSLSRFRSQTKFCLFCRITGLLAMSGEGRQVTCALLTLAAVSLHDAVKFDAKCLAYCACRSCNDCRQKPLSLSLTPEH